MDALGDQVKHLKEELRKERNQSRRAAESGLQLINEKKLLSRTLEEQSTKYLAVIESLKQENYVLKQNAAALASGINSPSCNVEIEAYQDQINLLSSEILEYKRIETEFNTNIKHLRKELEELLQEKDQLNSNLLEAENNARVQEEELKDAREKLLLKQTPESFTEDLSKFLELEQIGKEKEELLNIIVEKDKLLEFRDEQLCALKTENKTLKLEVMNKDYEICNTIQALQATKSEIDNKAAELEVMQYQQVDSSKRGNSLFAEVEDHRRKLENELISLRIKHKSLEECFDEKVTELLSLKQQFQTLLSMSNRSVDKSYITKLEQSLSQSQGEVLELSAKLQNAAKKSKEVGFTAVSPTELKGSSVEKGYSALISDLEKELEEKKKALETMRLLSASEKNQLTQCQRQLYQCEQDLTLYRNENMKLKLKLEDEMKKQLSALQRIVKPSEIKEKVPINADSQKENIPMETSNIVTPDVKTEVKMAMKKKVTICEEPRVIEAQHSNRRTAQSNTFVCKPTKEAPECNQQ